MIFNMFLNTIALIYLSMTNVTVVQFDHSIISVTSGKNKIDLYAVPTADNRALILKPLNPGLDTNIIVTTQGGTYAFDLKIDNLHPHKLIIVKSGKMDSYYRQIFKDESKIILEGEHTFQVISTSIKKINVNGKEIEKNRKVILPKGPPIIINGERLLL